MNRILAIDPGTRCGWAVSDHEAGVWDLRVRSGEGAGMRLVRFRSYIREVLDSGVQLVAYEDVMRHVGTEAAHIYGALRGVIQEECEMRNIPYVGIAVGTVKKHATGKGNAGKDAMIDAAVIRWGSHITDDNEADARWIREVAILQYGGGI